MLINIKVSKGPSYSIDVELTDSIQKVSKKVSGIYICISLRILIAIINRKIRLWEVIHPYVWREETGAWYTE